MKTAPFNPVALAACLALKHAYAEGGDDGAHPGSVDWSDVDIAHQFAVEALDEPHAKVALNLIGTLETLLCGLDEGESPSDLLNYINVQVRHVVQKATGRDTSAGHLTLSEELRAACHAGELLASLREVTALYGRDQDCSIEERISRFETARELINAIENPLKSHEHTGTPSRRPADRA